MTRETFEQRKAGIVELSKAGCGNGPSLETLGAVLAGVSAILLLAELVFDGQQQRGTRVDVQA